MTKPPQAKPASAQDTSTANEHLFKCIAQDLLTQGYSIKSNALPSSLSHALSTHIQQLPANTFAPAGIGRKQAHTLNTSVRSNKISWISDDTPAGADWLSWTEELQQFLNQRLFLGLFSFESHFAHYLAGDFYEKHLDAFKGESNRVLSLVTYLNEDWPADGGGELVIDTDISTDTRTATDEKNQHEIKAEISEIRVSEIRVRPELGTLVIFLSEDFPHCVLPARQDRYSIAGWFRVNTSSGKRADPPR